jgi:cell wall-associated NlpC family hydrolase
MRSHPDSGSIQVTVAVAAALVLLAAAFLGAGAGILGQAASACQAAPPASPAAAAIPAAYLAGYQEAGARYGIPWTVLAGIGEVESGHGRSNAPGVHSGANPAGAAGPMQFGIGGLAGNTWGGAPVHPASEHAGGYGTDGDHDGIVNVYDPGDAIPSAAYFLKANGAPGDLRAALFAYNHSDGYVTDVLDQAARYAAGGTRVLAAEQDPACQQADLGPLPAGTAGKILAYAEAQLGKPYLFSGGPGGEITLNPHVCPAQKADVSDSSGATGVVQATLDPEQRCVVAAAILYAVAQLGKPYVWGGTGPVGYDCSGLIMMAYRAAGVSLPRTTFQQVYAGTAVYSFSDLMPGDLLFTPGSDGTAEDPGHVGMYVGQGLVIQAPQTGEDIEITPFKGYWQQNVVAVRRVV